MNVNVVCWSLLTSTGRYRAFRRQSDCTWGKAVLATRNASYFQSVSSSRTVCRCHQSLYSGASHSQHLAPHQSLPPRLLDHLPVWESVVINGEFLLNKHCNGDWRLNLSYSQYLHQLRNSGHFIFRSLVLGQRNTVPMFGGLGGS
jgi:hypothetical protein